MIDSGAWKPLLLLPVLLVCIVIERGIKIFPILASIPPWVYLAGGSLFILYLLWTRLAYRDPPDKPRAVWIKPGVIEITGDVDNLQRKINAVGNPSSWTHIGYKRWRIETSGAWRDWNEKDLVDAINRDGGEL